MAVMANPAKRRYESLQRTHAAAETRHAILAAARDLFVEKGYGATTMQDIARAADVALDTIYASVGRKPQLFRLLIETAISGIDQPVEAEEREYVHAIHAAPDASKKLQVYASAIARIMPRLAPLFREAMRAASAHPELAQLWDEISERRAANMRRMAADLEATGGLAVPLQEAADVLWTMNSPDVFLLLTEQRGWTPERYSAWLAEVWERMLLQPRSQPPAET